MYLNATQVAELFAALDTRQVYQKSGDMLARPAQPGETVITIVSGAIETIKGTQIGDWVIRNIVVGSSAEMYPISAESFNGRYTILDEENPWTVDGHSWFRVKPSGMIVGGFYTADVSSRMGFSSEGTTARPLKFEAPWGADMVLEEGDFLGRPYPEVDLTNIYRVARKEFFQTYGSEPKFNLSVDKEEVVT